MAENDINWEEHGLMSDKEIEEIDENFKRTERDGIQNILKYFDRIHDKLFTFNNILIAGYFALSQFFESFSIYGIIIPIINLGFILLIEYRMMEKSRFESEITKKTSDEIEKNGLSIDKTTRYSLYSIISTAIVVGIFIFNLFSLDSKANSIAEPNKPLHKENIIGNQYNPNIPIENYQNYEKSVSAESENNSDPFCDSTKFIDFKSNLFNINDLKFETNHHDLKAKDFISQQCKLDSLFCGEISKKIIKKYNVNSEWNLDLVGYVLGQDNGLEEKSASFFVLTIYRNNKVWFVDILEDLEGEIQAELNGFENNDRQVIVWGHAYPYFKLDYGKFRLTIKNGTGFYDYECHAKH